MSTPLLNHSTPTPMPSSTLIHAHIRVRALAHTLALICALACARVGAKIVNPWNTEDMALAIYEALTMPADVRAANQAKLLRYVRKHTAAFWGASFVAELKRASEANERRDYLPRLNVNRVRELFARAQRLRVRAAYDVQGSDGQAPAHGADTRVRVACRSSSWTTTERWRGHRPCPSLRRRHRWC